MTSAQLMLIVPALVVCFIACVWFVLSERRRLDGISSGDTGGGENASFPSTPVDDYFSKSIYSRIGDGKNRKSPLKP